MRPPPSRCSSPCPSSSSPTWSFLARPSGSSSGSSSATPPGKRKSTRALRGGGLRVPGQQPLERDRVMDEFSGKIIRWAGAALIFLVGGAHVLISGEHFLTATSLGVLFLANFFGSAVVALALYWSPNRWPWLLGDLISGATFAGFVVSRTIGLPGTPEFVGQWFN